MGEAKRHKLTGLYPAMDDRPICIVRFLPDGGLDYLLSGDAVFLVIDERTPHDRLYRMTLQTPPAVIKALIGDSPVGSRHDARHAAVAHKIKRYLEGRRHLEEVDDE